jgi:anti-anti-sigma factor
MTSGVSTWNGDAPAEVPRLADQPGVFEIGAMDIPGARVVWCRGELDISSEEQVVTEIARALGHPLNSIVLDLRCLTFVDCTVIRCIEYAAAACERCQVTLYVDAGQSVKKLAATLGRDQLGAAESYI